LPFSPQMKLPPCFHHWDHKGNYVQWHSLTTVDVWKAPLWTTPPPPHELNKIIKKSFFPSFFFFCSFIYGVIWKAR
jgi:hypothetical protein